MSTGVHEIPRWQLIEGDCVEAMRSMADGSVDSICCDPPYEIAMMGKSWDATGIAYSVEMWREALRVLKPGGYLAAFGATRTYHRMACAIEDAGFEIRDSIHWIFGSGMPKGWSFSNRFPAEGWCACEDETDSEHHLRSLHDGDLPTPRTLDGRALRNSGCCARCGKLRKEFEGFDVALKPAHEPIVLARAPLAGTIAENVQEFGTGALNIDGCRIPALSGLTSGGACVGKSALPMNALNGVSEARARSEEHPAGRWPSNFLLSHDHAEDESCTPECPVAMLDAQAGPLKSGGRNGVSYETGHPGSVNTYGGGVGKGGSGRCIADEGNCSRFFPVFYCPKASKADRGEGNSHPTVKSTALLRWLCRLITPPGGTVLDPFCGSGSTLVAAVREGFRCIGIEQSAEYCAIIRRRLGEPEEHVDETRPSATRSPKQLDLFAAAGGAR